MWVFVVYILFTLITVWVVFFGGADYFVNELLSPFFSYYSGRWNEMGFRIFWSLIWIVATVKLIIGLLYPDSQKYLEHF